MLAIAPGPEAQAAASIVVALNEGDGAKAVEILRGFSDPIIRVGVGAQAIALGADPESVGLAVKAAAKSPAEVQQTEIEMDAEVMRRVYRVPWYKRTWVQVAGLALGVTGVYYLRKRGKITVG